MKVLLMNQIPKVNNKYTSSLSGALLDLEVDIRVGGFCDEDLKVFDKVQYVPVFDNYSRINKRWKKIKSYYESLKRTFDYCLNEGIDIVHLQWFTFSPLDYWFLLKLRKRKIKTVVTIHDLIPFNKKFYDIYFLKRIYCKCDALINQAEINKKELINTFGVDEDKIYYIPHGNYIDYSESVNKIDAKKYFNLEDKKIVLFFGQIKEVKGVDVLINAMSEVVRKIPNAVCLIAGKVWKDDFSKYRKIIAENGMESNFITHIQYIPDDKIKYYFSAADIVVLPYKKSYQSGVVQLAYSYSRAVIATSEGEFPNVIKNDETGILVKSKDCNALSKAIVKLLLDENKLIEFGKAGHLDMEKRFSWQRIGEMTTDVYCKLHE